MKDFFCLSLNSIILWVLISLFNIAHGEVPRENATFLGQKIYLGQKKYGKKVDPIFIDGVGREVYFRGWNISGAVKLKSMHFMPFKTQKDAAWAFKDLRERTGTNIIRYTLSWEAIHPRVDIINNNYLHKITLQIKEAIKNNIYVLLDYHQDLFSRHLFDKNSRYTGNGAPSWITPKEDYPTERCRICSHWGMNNIFNRTITQAFQNFWNSSTIWTENGPRRIQDEYLWQMEKMITFLNKNLTPRELQFIIGINPMNEPIDGGFDGLSSKEWYEQKMAPFNRSVRNLLNKMGWFEKFVFAEPLVLWNTNAPTIHNYQPFNYEAPPSRGFVFNSHYYDALRMSISLRPILNGAYLGNMDHIRKTAAHLKRPPFLSEFGMFIKNERVKNQVRMIEATYQGMEVSKKRYSNSASFYSPSISGTQWHWDIYHNTHSEPLNGNSHHIITKGDAWNDENFSIVTKKGKSYTTPDSFGVERAWPRRCQGRIMHFYYKGMPFDGRKEKLNWMALKFDSSNKVYLENHRFFFMVWKGHHSFAPTEIYLPPHFKMKKMTFITEEFIKKGSGRVSNKLQTLFSINDVSEKLKKTGERVLIWNKNKSKEAFHFFLAIKENKTPLTLPLLQTLKNNIKRMIQKRKSPLTFLGTVKTDKVHIGKRRKVVTY